MTSDCVFVASSTDGDVVLVECKPRAVTVYSCGIYRRASPPSPSPPAEP